MIKELLVHPLTRGMDIDDPRTTHLRREIVRTKPFLRKIYEEWYRDIVAALPPCDGPVLELGSGAGFLGEFIPGLITSEIFATPRATIVLDAHAMPLRDGSLRAIVMTNVLHHLAAPVPSSPRRAAHQTGWHSMIMIEPWVTAGAMGLHSPTPRAVCPRGLPVGVSPNRPPLGRPTGALPWILFVRDHEQFKRDFPMWELRTIRPIMPFRYLVSGGVSLRSLVPGWTFGAWHTLENCMRPWGHHWAMFAQIVLTRV